MTDESKLLEILKRMYKARYKFGFTNNNDPSSYIHWQDDGGNVFRIPHYSEVEERIVEVAKQYKKDLHIIYISRINEWQYTLSHVDHHRVLKWTLSSNQDRLIAVCQLWLELQKLNKEQ